MTLPLRRKAFAYITRGSRLLVFEHTDFPEAGIQVPAGTMNEGEAPEAAALREAYEETGLTGLVSAGLLGVARRDMSDFGREELHERHFYHLRYEGEAPAEWEHWQRGGAVSGPGIRFRLYWVSLPDGVPALIADHGALLPELLRRMELAPSSLDDHAACV